MDKTRLTEGNFDRTVRKELRYEHGFGHDKLDRAKRIVSEAIAHVEEKKHTTGLSARNLDTAMAYLDKKHAEWRGLPEYERRHVEDALNEHFGTKPEDVEEEQEPPLKEAA